MLFIKWVTRGEEGDVGERQISGLSGSVESWAKVLCTMAAAAPTSPVLPSVMVCPPPSGRRASPGRVRVLRHRDLESLWFHQPSDCIRSLDLSFRFSLYKMGTIRLLLGVCWEDRMIEKCQIHNRGSTCEPPSQLATGTCLCWAMFTDSL